MEMEQQTHLYQPQDSLGATFGGGSFATLVKRSLQEEDKGDYFQQDKQKDVQQCNQSPGGFDDDELFMNTNQGNKSEQPNDVNVFGYNPTKVEEQS